MNRSIAFSMQLLNPSHFSRNYVTANEENLNSHAIWGFFTPIPSSVATAIHFQDFQEQWTVNQFTGFRYFIYFWMNSFLSSVLLTSTRCQRATMTETFIVLLYALYLFWQFFAKYIHFPKILFHFKCSLYYVSVTLIYQIIKCFGVSAVFNHIRTYQEKVISYWMALGHHPL